MRTLQKGDIIRAKYEVDRVLGQGGMGIVFAARHLVMNELFALKFFHPSLHAKPELLERLVREARAGMRINGPHVAQVHDVDTFEGAPFMVMEYPRGQDLAARLLEHGPVPIREAIDLLLEACEAVNEAHALGIVHRDLKPGNLFLTTGSNGRPFVKVLDFGIAISLDASVAESPAVIGSPHPPRRRRIAHSRRPSGWRSNMG
jgi:serine/threonine-protein kinase